MSKTLRIVPDSLSAWIDEQPGVGKKRKLFATVKVSVEVDWKVKLVSVVPQGINPAIKLLKFEVETPPSGKVHSNAMADETVNYEELLGGQTYKELTIENGEHPVTTTVKVTV